MVNWLVLFHYQFEKTRTMKKFGFLSLFAVLTFSVQAQMQTPAPSPSSSLEQMVGLTNVAVEYSRPSAKGRTIFGDLVPYDKLWIRSLAGQINQLRWKVTSKDLRTFS